MSGARDMAGPVACLAPDASILVLTGAGVSAESGLPTFRGAGGLWQGHRAEDVATPEAFARDPALVHAFYNERRRALRDPAVAPNAAHQALAALEAAWRGSFQLVTQNVDDLHERAGSRRVIHMHGELTRSLCTACGDARECRDELAAGLACAACGAVGCLRPDVVWFGEMPRRMDEIMAALRKCDLFVAIGTSGRVYPAAGFVREARAAGAHTLELDLRSRDTGSGFAETRSGPATRLVPGLVAELLAIG
jgi:NAD-dependent deacetylase